MEKQELGFENFFSSDDEIYTMQCPDFINQDTVKFILQNMEVKKTTELKTKKNEFFNVDMLNTNNGSLTVALPVNSENASLKVLSLSGHIVIQKAASFSQSNKDYMENSEKHFVVPSLTEITKRHPLLGTEWTNHIEISDKAINKNLSLFKKLESGKQKLLNDKSRKRKHVKSDENFVLKGKKKKKCT